MNEIIFLVEEDPEGVFFARSIGESIFTQAETIAELRLFVRDAVNCHYGRQYRLKPVLLINATV
jgi:hypothetical protein